MTEMSNDRTKQAELSEVHVHRNYRNRTTGGAHEEADDATLAVHRFVTQPATVRARMGGRSGSASTSPCAST